MISSCHVGVCMYVLMCWATVLMNGDIMDSDMYVHAYIHTYMCSSGAIVMRTCMHNVTLHNLIHTCTHIYTYIRSGFAEGDVAYIHTYIHTQWW